MDLHQAVPVQDEALVVDLPTQASICKETSQKRQGPKPPTEDVFCVMRNSTIETLSQSA